MDKWSFIRAFPDKLPPPEPEPAESLQKMDEAVLSEPASSSTREPVVPCRANQRWLELTILDPNNQPLANTPCKLLIPEGNGLEKNTDDAGFVRFDGIFANPETFEVHVHRDDAGSTPSYRIEVVPRKRDAPAPLREEPDENIRYMKVPWEDQSARLSE